MWNKVKSIQLKDEDMNQALRKKRTKRKQDSMTKA
jgi:hypothetical protein